MDTLTHALSGALLARAIHRPTQRMSAAAYTGVGFLVCAFPDADIILRWVDLLYYFNWHRGVTHSLVLLPLWAVALAAALHGLSRRRWPFGELVVVTASALALHILGDLITAYGTRIWMPLSDLKVAWNTTFIIDPYFTGILFSGLLASTLLHSRTAAQLALATIVAYVGLQFHWQQRAEQFALDYVRREELSPVRVLALPQPLSPLNWKLVVEEDGVYHRAYLRLWGQSHAPQWLTWLQPAAAAYRPPHRLQWKILDRFGAPGPAAEQASAAWDRPEFVEYRRFAGLPRLYRIDQRGEQRCIWFTDERFVLPGLTPPFRFGLCRTAKGQGWKLERLPWGDGQQQAEAT